MWILLISDGDVDYTYPFGPFDSEEAAYAAAPASLDDDYEVRAVVLRVPAEIDAFFQEV